MKANELTQYVFADRYPFFASWFAHWFAHWIESSKQFRIFVENDRNKKKIRAKVNNAKTDEDFRDVWFEFGMAYLMLQNNRFSEVEYEKYGAEKKKRAPDFTVTHKTGTIFNVEVRRIRKPKLQKRFEKLKKDIAKQIPAVPSTLAVRICIEYIDEFDPSPDLLERLEDRISDIINCIINTIPEAERNTPVDGVKRYSVPDFKGEVELVFRKPSSKITHTLSYYGVSPSPTLRTLREYYKFGDIICEKLGQMRPGEINVLAVITDSDTHDDFDFGKAVASLDELVARKDDTFFRSKGFADTDDFLKQFKQLSGVFFRGPWEIIPTDGTDTLNYPNGLWCNEGTDCQVPEDICETLRRMD